MSMLNLMEIFYSVALQHSFTKAAGELALSKSYISMQISTLETQLGTKLLNRTTRHLSLTEAGEAFLESCKKIIAERNQALVAVKNIKNEPTGHLKISAPPSMCASYLSVLLPLFVNAYPHITVELESSVKVKDLITSGIDIAIRMTRKPDENYIARLLGDFKLAVCATPEYLQSTHLPKKPQDLTNHNCLVYSSAPEGFYWEFVNNKHKEKIHVRGNIISDNSFTVQEAMLSHIGIARLPSYLLHKDLKNSKITLLLEEYNQLTFPIYALYAMQPTAKTKVFLHFLKAYFAVNTL
jgi:LysR family transcriptional regulator for bpeEF and oprC